MKRILFLSMLALGIILFTDCYKTVGRFPNQTEIAQLAKSLEDSTLSHNNEMVGKFVYTHLKYYLGTLDMSTFLPNGRGPALVAAIKQKINAYEGWSNQRIYQDLFDHQYITAHQQSYLNGYDDAMNQFFGNGTVQTSGAAWNFFLDQESKILGDTSLTYHEKNALLLQHTVVRYAVKWKMDQYVSRTPITTTLGNSGVQTLSSSIWSTIACYAGTIASFVQISTAFGGKDTVLAAAIGSALGAADDLFTCGSGTNTNVCQDPLTVSLDYQCYTYGTPLYFTAVGYGNTMPSQFVWSFADNNNLLNDLYSNFVNGNPYMTLPGSYLTSNISDIAVQVKTSCSAGDPLWFGWFTLDSLGKPYFVLNGTSEMTVSQAEYYPSFEYDASGPIEYANATISWQIIPSGYPGYSATGYFEGGTNTPMVFIHWNPTPGFAEVACTATVGCASITNYYEVQIESN